MEAKPSFNPQVPSIARTYDYLLGGKDNYPVDREVGEIFVRKFPGAVQIALDNRACLVRAVTFIAGELGIDQFIDLGSGLPTADNVHQVAQRAGAAPGWSTWTTTRSSWRTAVPCSPRTSTPWSSRLISASPRRSCPTRRSAT